MPGADSKAVSKYRRNKKKKLVEYYGGLCVDCGYAGPPFMYDFDHRDPSTKVFSIGEGGNCLSWERTVEEADKCDLVCSNCHRLRTHKQRCTDCEYCG